ncbi:Zinc finger FYVE domain-containing protein [Trichinella pseudospiralis]
MCRTENRASTSMHTSYNKQRTCALFIDVLLALLCCLSSKFALMLLDSRLPNTVPFDRRSCIFFFFIFLLFCFHCFTQSNREERERACGRMGCNVTGDAFCPRICRIDFLSTASRISYQFIFLLFFLIGPTLWKVWKKKKKQRFD